MIDHVKIVIRAAWLIEKVWNNPLLIFHSDQEKRFNDEIRTFRKKTYKGLTFTLFADKLEITGSLHKYFNNGIHNANDFSFLDCIRVVIELELVFGLDLSMCYIENLEFGLNIVPTESVQNIVVWLKFHERNEFRYYPDLQYAKQAASFSISGKINEYKTIKAYAKGLQRFNGECYGDPNNFRFEVRSKQAKYFNRFGIFTLADLASSIVYLRLSDEIMKEWNNVLLIDKNLPEERKISKYKSSDFWENCINQYRNKFSAQKRKYFELLNNYPGNLHKQIHDLLSAKIGTFASELKSSAISKPRQFTRKNINGANSTMVNIESAPLCKVTGLIIPDEQPQKKYLTPMGIRWYYRNKPKLYHSKLEKLLTEKWKSKNMDEPVEVWIDEIAHKIRCSLSNQRRNPVNNTKNSFKKLESKGLKLWPSVTLMANEKLKLLNQ